ncbi:MAG: sigma-E factor negative regulatory protein [Thermomonas sp.]
MKTAGINREMAMDATNLTQLSSREQLSALMDGALPADETRFLLRRLKHDASLAESWERWRLSAEVMRGLAPTRRLPADFASRVAASLREEEEAHREEEHPEQQHHETGTHTMRSSAWLRWGGGAAVAASLAVVAFMNQPAGIGAPGGLADHAAVAVALSPAPVPKTPAPQSPAQDPTGMDLESQTAALASAVAVVARPSRNNRRNSQSRATQVESMQAASVLASTTAESPIDIGLASTSNIAPLLPQTDIIARPWPRSVLPHYGNNTALAVGFGDSARNAAPYNPFQMRTSIGNLPPALIVDPPAGDAATPVNDELRRAADSEPRS